MIYSYLTSRKQLVKINSTYSSWLDAKSGVPQGSVLSPLLCNIFINGNDIEAPKVLDVQLKGLHIELS